MTNLAWHEDGLWRNSVDLRVVARAGASLEAGDCGCFGVHLGQELRWWVPVEDAEFVALAACVSWAERRTKGARTV